MECSLPVGSGEMHKEVSIPKGCLCSVSVGKRGTLLSKMIFKEGTGARNSQAKKCLGNHCAGIMDGAAS